MFVIRNKNNKTFFLKGTAIISIFTFVSPPLSLSCLFLLCKAWVLSPQPYSEDSMGCRVFSGLLQGFAGVSSLHPGLQDLNEAEISCSSVPVGSSLLSIMHRSLSCHLLCHSASCSPPPPALRELHFLPSSSFIIQHRGLEVLTRAAGVQPAVGLWKPERVWASALNKEKRWQETSF